MREEVQVLHYFSNSKGRFINFFRICSMQYISKHAQSSHHTTPPRLHAWCTRRPTLPAWAGRAQSFCITRYYTHVFQQSSNLRFLLISVVQQFMRTPHPSVIFSNHSGRFSKFLTPNLLAKEQLACRGRCRHGGMHRRCSARAGCAAAYTAAGTAYTAAGTRAERVTAIRWGLRN